MEPRIAILLCGQVRNYWYTLPYTMDNIIIPNNTDIFCVLDNGQWTSSGYERYDPDILKNHIKEILGPYLKDLLFESDISNFSNEYTLICDKMNPENQDINRLNIVTQWLEKKLAFDLLEKYMEINKKSYDTILFLRPDVYYDNVKIPLCNTNEIFLTTRCGSTTCSWMMDNFYFGGFSAMKIISRFGYEYGNLKYVACPTCNIGVEYRFVMEVQFGLYILNKGLDTKYISYDIPSRRGERIPSQHPKSINKLNITYGLKYVIDQIKIHQIKIPQIKIPQIKIPQIISILGSCRQESIKKYYNCTDLHEETSWPHYTKEILQIIKYAKYGGIEQKDANYIFRKCILKYGNLDFNKIKQLFNSTTLFVLEIASRLSYEYNGFYLHHIASESAYGDPNIVNQIKIRSLSDEEIENDVKEIKDELYPKKLAIITHFSTYDGKRKQLATLIKNICSKLNIFVYDPSELLQYYTVNDLFTPEAVLSHYTTFGHEKVGEKYKTFIDSAYN